MSAGAPARVEDRVERLAAGLREQGVDALLVDGQANVRYLTGFTGSHGLALVAATDARAEGRGCDRFLTDFRYETQSADQVPARFAREIVAGSLFEGAARSLGAAGGRLGFDGETVTVSAYERLRESLPAGWELVGVARAVERLREVKDDQEVARIRVACELADEALAGLLEDGIVGRTEREAAVELELRMRRLGAEAASFPPIIASGAHAALPHAEPREVAIAPGALVTIDWGARVDGYCSDCTRTYATGERIPEGARRIYELVLAAQQAALAGLRPGLSGREVDAIAREIIHAAGQGEHFGHGLGHGVGIEVHEGPRLSRIAGEEPLRPGNVVTVEPGVYLPGRLGVRIEDLVVVAEDAPEVLTPLPKGLTVIA